MGEIDARISLFKRTSAGSVLVFLPIQRSGGLFAKLIKQTRWLRIEQTAGFHFIKARQVPHIIKPEMQQKIFGCAVGDRLARCAAAASRPDPPLRVPGPAIIHTAPAYRCAISQEVDAFGRGPCARRRRTFRWDCIRPCPIPAYLVRRARVVPTGTLHGMATARCGGGV